MADGVTDALWKGEVSVSEGRTVGGSEVLVCLGGKVKVAVIRKRGAFVGV